MKRPLPRVLAPLLLAAGCGPGGRDGGAGPTPPSGDEAIFLAMLEGTIPPAEGVAEVAAAGGWPIETDADFVFVHLAGPSGSWSLAGDHDGWAGAAMEHAVGFWWIRVPIPSPDGSRYRFRDAAGAHIADPRSRRYGYDGYGEYSLVTASAAHLERFFDVTDGSVGPRTVRVRVPAAPATHHLYVHDGQNLFDPGAAHGGWRLDESLGAGTLAVGVDHTPARITDYTHVQDDLGAGPIGGGGDAYADFVHGTVRPMIEARYGAPSRRGTMGSSLGGLIAYHLALRHDGEYDFAASLSGTMGWGSITLANETMIERWVAAGRGGTRLYLDSGGGPGDGCVDSDADGIEDDGANDSDNYCVNRQFADELAAAGYAFGIDLWHWHEPGAAHDEAAWSARVWRPVGLFESL